MMRGMLCGLLLLCSSMPLSAAVYKWVDKQGHTHFSQTPPSTEQVQSSARLNAKLGASAIEPVENGNQVMCGHLVVQPTNMTDEQRASYIQKHIKEWEQQRQRLEQQRLTNKTLAEQYAEYDCRTRWGYQTLQHLRSFSYMANKAYEALQNDYKKLKARQEDECSTDPKKLGKTMLVGKEANDWGKCYNAYRYQLRKLRQKMKENRRSLSDIK